MLALLPGGNDPETDDPLTAFLADGDKIQLITPPWQRLLKLSGQWPSQTVWKFEHSTCGTCRANCTVTTNEQILGSVLDFTLCLNCGQVIGRENTPDGRPLRLPISGTSWMPACLAVKMLRKTALRPRYMFRLPPGFEGEE